LGFLFYNLCTEHEEGLFLSTAITGGPLLSALKEDVNCLSRASQLSSDAVMRWIWINNDQLLHLKLWYHEKAPFLVSMEE
jgi:hypothetical protein